MLSSLIILPSALKWPQTDLSHLTVRLGGGSLKLNLWVLSPPSNTGFAASAPWYFIISGPLTCQSLCWQHPTVPWCLLGAQPP